MVKEIRIEAKSVSGIIGLRKFVDSPSNCAELEIKMVKLNPCTISIIPIAEEIKKDWAENIGFGTFNPVSYPGLLKKTLKGAYRIKNYTDYVMEFIE
jgi:hypothetical protein